MNFNLPWNRAIALIGNVISKFLLANQQYIYSQYRKKYSVDKTFRFIGKDICLFGSGKIILGENSYMGDGSSIQSLEGCEVRIGKNCSISHNVRIYTSNLDAKKIIGGNKSDENNKTGNVVIGDHCWIGANVFIKQNVTIGDYCVITANSLVTRDVPSHTAVGGVPAAVWPIL